MLNKILVITSLVLLFGMCIFVFCMTFLKKEATPDEKFLKKYYDELAENPNSAKAYMEIARDNITAYPNPYDPQKALADINKAIELDSNLVEAYHLRVLLNYYTFGNKDAALDDLETILKISPDDSDAQDLKEEILNRK